MRLAFLLAAALLVPLSSCKQGEGQYCQINADCKDGLVCAQITDTCEKSASSSIDAGPDAVPLDAAPPDAEVPDATPLPQCSDGVDNETVPDGQIDFPSDPQCTSAADDDESA
jgi:hypothetical protein